MTIRGRFLAVTASCAALVVALSGCDGSDDPSASSSPSASASRPAEDSLPAATGATPLQLGAPLWSTRQQERGLGTYTSAAVADGTVVLFGTEGVAAVAATSGRVLWSYADRIGRRELRGGGGIELNHYALKSRDLVTASRTDDPLVLVGYIDDGGDDTMAGVAALRLRTGRVAWTKKFTDDLTHYSQAPSVRIMSATERGVVVSVTPSVGADEQPAAQARTVVLDTATGRVRWTRTALTPWLLSGDVVVATERRGTVGADPYAAMGPLVGLDARTGDRRWRSTSAATQGVPEAATDRTVVVGNTRSVLLDTATGRPLWTSTGDAFCESDGHVLVACKSQDRLVSWSTADPVVRSSRREVTGLPRLVADGRVYFDQIPDWRAVDTAGRPALPRALPADVAAAGDGVVVLAEKGLYNDSPMTVRSLRAVR